MLNLPAIFSTIYKSWAGRLCAKCRGLIGIGSGLTNSLFWRMDMDSFDKISAPTLKELFVSRMAGMILSGKLGIGEKFPPERTLAEQMGISKSVVHAGLQELNRMGLVCIRPQSGVYVADYLSDGNLETFNAIVKFNGDALSTETISGLFDLRLALEGFAMRRLAREHGESDIAALRKCVDSIGLFVASPAFSYPELAKRFFDYPKLVCRLSNCGMLALCFKAVEEGAIYLTERYIRSIGTSAAITQLEQFTDLIELGDGDGATRLLKDCMDSQLERYAKRLV